MKSTDPVLDLLSRSIHRSAADVRRFLLEERGLDIPPNLVREGMAEVLYRRIDDLAEDLAAIFTSPDRAEFHELERSLLKNAASPEPVAVAEAAVEASVFSGQRAFSVGKMEAMIQYLLGRGRAIYKTNLNKLLFYSDFTAYYLRGSGISGAVYLNRPYGPVADPAAEVLDDLVEQGRVTVAERTKHFVAASDVPANLDDEDLRILDWVLETYGDMGAREISDHSHDERAYRDTRPNEPIAYRYSQYFRHLPPKNLLTEGQLVNSDLE